MPCIFETLCIPLKRWYSPTRMKDYVMKLNVTCCTLIGGYIVLQESSGSTFRLTLMMEAVCPTDTLYPPTRLQNNVIIQKDMKCKLRTRKGESLAVRKSAMGWRIFRNEFYNCYSSAGTVKPVLNGPFIKRNLS
jgi:hypothetical protein